VLGKLRHRTGTASPCTASAVDESDDAVVKGGLHLVDGRRVRPRVAKDSIAMFPIYLLVSLVVAWPVAAAWGDSRSGAGRLALTLGIALILAGTITLLRRGSGPSRSG
jgi:hypothetical protein